jgi:TDG/mug DNA glycosylase family protein
MGGNGRETVKAGLAPVAAADARLIILGSLPGDASLAASRYYAHPANQFWRLLGAAIGEDLAGTDYEARLALLERRGIGLWDVVGSARRRGSLDQTIRDAAANPLAEWLAGFSRLEAVAFNGKAAAALGRQLLGDARFALVDLPSSSAANTKTFADKLAVWRELARYCG